MRSFFIFFRRNLSGARLFSTTIKMSGTSSAAALYAAVVSTTQPGSAVPEDVKELKHHVKGGKGFTNPWESYADQKPLQIVWAMASRHLTGKANKPDTTPPTVPVRTPEFLPTRENSSEGKLRATWLGHACYYVEFPSGLRVLFDPVFENRCSPFSWLGPARFTPAPCKIEDIPIIDAVIISHNHYDHLSLPTVSAIAKKHPNAVFFAPLGNKKWFEASGIKNSHEMDWWDLRELKLVKTNASASSKTSVDSSVGLIRDGQNGVSVGEEGDIVATIGCLPCQHITARTPFDKCHTLWASWSVESGGKKVWFGGDTGYRAVPDTKGEDDYGPKYAHLPRCPAFSEIGRLRGPFDLGLIPIGAYDPRFIFSSMHANPEDSVNILKDTKCQQALGIHWGTWVLTEEDVLEPPKFLRAALKKYGIPETGVFDVCEIGESREI